MGTQEAADTATLEKRAAARAASELVESGMRLGLGTGSTVAELLPAIAERGLSDLRCVSTSPATERQAAALGLNVEPFEALDELDLAIDGADQIAADGWVIKGGGGAHLREKIVAAAADRFVVIASSEKSVARLHAPVPLELHQFGLAATLRRLSAARLRVGAPLSPDAGVIADLGEEPTDPRALAARLDADPGVAAHGLFEPELTSLVIVARGSEIERSERGC